MDRKLMQFYCSAVEDQVAGVDNYVIEYVSPSFKGDTLEHCEHG